MGVGHRGYNHHWNASSESLKRSQQSTKMGTFGKVHKEWEEQAVSEGGWYGVRQPQMWQGEEGEWGR